MVTIVSSPTALLDLVGCDLGPGEWIPVPRNDIEHFAAATHHPSWSYSASEFTNEGPCDEGIAPGCFTLALLMPMWSQLLVIERAGPAVHFGFNRVRFLSPVPAGSRVRLGATVAAVEEVKGNGYQVTVAGTVECNRSDKPAVVAEMVYRYYS